jgi:PAS domain S-box-containing protein
VAEESDAELYRLLVASVRDYAIFLLDRQGYVTTWSAGAERIKGYAAADIIGRHFSVFYSEEDVRAHKPEHELEVAAEVGRFEDEGWRLRRDGTRFWANVVITALRDEQGRLRGFGKVTRDLTERLHAETLAREAFEASIARSIAEAASVKIAASEEAQRQTAEQLRVVLSNLDEAVTVQDRSGKLVYANPAAAKMARCASVEELLATPREAIRARFEATDEHGAPLGPTDSPATHVLGGEPPAPLLVRWRERGKDPTQWFSVRASAILDTKGDPLFAVNVWRDVTDVRNRAEEAQLFADAATALASSLDEEAALDGLSRALVPQLADLCVIDVLEDDEKLRHLAVAHPDPSAVDKVRELQRRCPLDWREGEEEPVRVLRTGQSVLHREIPPALLDAFAGDEAHKRLLVELRLRSVMIVPLRAGDDVLGIMMLFGSAPNRVWDSHTLDVALEIGRRAGTAILHARLYRNSQRAVRVRDEFLTVAGHELKTPLAALSLQLESMAAAIAIGTVGADLDRWAVRLAKTLRHAGRLERLVAQLVDVSSFNAGELVLERAPVDFGALVAEAVERFRDEAERASSTVLLSRQGQTGAAGVAHLDRRRAEQVVDNLLRNALKYGAGKPVEVRVTTSKEEVTLCVRDHGIGVAPIDQSRIFDRFERAVSDRHYGGFGLGLWIARTIVEAHGGRITLESTPGEGSTFLVTLPKGGP